VCDSTELVPQFLTYFSSHYTDSAHKASTAPAVADSLRAQLRAKESEIEGLQQKLIVMENKIRELTSNLDDERCRHKLGQSSTSDLAKSMDDIDAKNRMLENRLQTIERQSAEEVARLNEKNRVLEERNRVLEKRTQTSERESAAEIARLNAEIDRLKSLFNQQQQAPKLVGIGMRITTDPPHRVTEIVAGGAAYQSGEIAVGDYILQVGNMDVSHFPIEKILKNILGPAGSYLDLRLDRRDENEESNVFTVTIKRSEILPTGSQPYQRVCALAYNSGLCTTKRLHAHVHMLSSV